MASQANGGQKVPGNLSVFGDADVNGDLNVDGNQTVVGTLAVTGALTAPSLAAPSATFATHIKLTPTADPPAGAAEGMIYADTDHKIYFHNGTTWKEITFAA